MGACTFFGHRDCPDDIEPILREVIERLIVDENVDTFFVGDSGGFDKMVFRVLRELENYLYNIRILLVLSRFPEDNMVFHEKYTILPDEVELAPNRFAIDYRNRYMLNNSDFVVTYTVCDFGGAYKFESMARRKGKTVINVAEVEKERKMLAEQGELTETPSYECARKHIEQQRFLRKRDR